MSRCQLGDRCWEGPILDWEFLIAAAINDESTVGIGYGQTQRCGSAQGRIEVSSRSAQVPDPTG